MAIEDASHGVADRLVEVVALDQHSEQTGNRAFFEVPGTLEDARQQVEDRRRIALLTWGVTGGKADFALRHGEAGDRVHNQQDIVALVAEVLADRDGDEGGA